MLTEGHTFEVWVGDEMRASTWAAARDGALREARHYEWTYRDEPDVRVYEVTRRIVPSEECATCRGARWVCEDHPDVPWGFEPGHCECGGAGMMCACNPGNGIVPPAEPKEQR